MTHASFGLIAGIFTLNPFYAISTTAFAVLIDLDHVLWILGYPVIGRPNHSLPFLLVVSVVFGILFKRRNHFNFRLSTAVASGVFSHMAYDSFVDAPSLPLLMPFSSELISLPTWSWMLFETLAIISALIGLLLSKRKKNEKSI
mgnify:CR=1 FL=1